MSNRQSLKGVTPDATIGEIINAEQNAGELLASIGLSPENHKTKTLRSVCQQKQWSEVEVLKWLKKNQQVNGVVSENNTEERPDFGNDLQKWCDYLDEHFVIKNSELLDDIMNDLPRVHKIHGNQYSWIKQIHWHMEQLEEKLSYYFYFLRNKLFPLLDELDNSTKEILHGTTKKVSNGIEIVEEDQREIIELIDTIEEKGRGLKNPEAACSTLRILNQNTKILFSSLRKQIEIEREYIIPLIEQKLESG